MGSIPKTIECPLCDGSGQDLDDGQCEQCSGEGEIIIAEYAKEHGWTPEEAYRHLKSQASETSNDEEE